MVIAPLLPKCLSFTQVCAEAAYDAFMTGTVFVAICKHLKVGPQDMQNAESGLAPYCNRLYLMRMDPCFLVLPGPNPVQDRSAFVQV